MLVRTSNLHLGLYQDADLAAKCADGAIKYMLYI